MKMLVKKDEFLENLQTATLKTYHPGEEHYCRACRDAYGPAVEKITRGFCADCYHEIRFDEITCPKDKLVAHIAAGFSPDKMRAGFRRW